MEIKAHLTTGNVLTFEMDAERPADLIKQIKPKDIFRRPVHQFLGNLRMVTINPQQVEWFEVNAGPVPKNALMPTAPLVRQLTRETFAERVSVEKNSLMTAMEITERRNVFLGFATVTFLSGFSLYLELQSVVGTASERVASSMKLFSQVAVFVNAADGGMLIINPANIQIWQVVPGLQKSTPFTVKAELKSIERKKG
ncbi:MAG: hypothetical protein K1X53_03005 [Candidatus Sumerlaeaceae bacterium]|nr:hypothetical protein [Candidatus Sumerlaeaceae bacterium]